MTYTHTHGVNSVADPILIVAARKFDIGHNYETLLINRSVCASARKHCTTGRSRQPCDDECLETAAAAAAAAALVATAAGINRIAQNGQSGLFLSLWGTCEGIHH